MFGIKGETVTVIRPCVERDELGEPIEGEPERENVENVLVAPGATGDMDETRPQGVSVVFTLHFPKGYGKPLRGCEVEVRGIPHEVVGDPQPYTEANVPGPWSMPVEVTRKDG